jgi:hypothetical protein
MSHDLALQVGSEQQIRQITLPWNAVQMSSSNAARMMHPPRQIRATLGHHFTDGSVLQV